MGSANVNRIENDNITEFFLCMMEKFAEGLTMIENNTKVTA